MPSIKSLAEYEKDRLQTIQDLKEDGSQGSFGTKSGGTHTNSGTYQEVCTEYYITLDAVTEWMGTPLETGQKVLMVSNEFNLLKNDLFFNDLNRVVKDVKPFPDWIDKPIYYEVLINV